MTRIEQEKKTVRQMVEIYCHGKKHESKGLCEGCSALLDYAYARLDHCKYGENKPVSYPLVYLLYYRERRKQAILATDRKPDSVSQTDAYVKDLNREK